jgi:hypothetical protein
MPYIENTDDLDWYRERFSDIWESATLTYSSIEVNGRHIPNGELVFLRESCEEGVEVLYNEGPLSIIEVTTTSPFDLLEQLSDGTLPTKDGSTDIQSRFPRHTPNNHFQSGEGRVRDTRPMEEVNGAIRINIPEDLEDEYHDVKDGMDDRLMRATEPYYSIGRCEGYYFDYIFRSNRDRPVILLFADTAVNLSINESGTLELVAPESLFEELYVSVLPQMPYDEHRGWQISFSETQLESLKDGRARYTEELDLTGIEELYALMYLGDRLLKHVEHTTGDDISENPRFEIMQAFDQDNNLAGYLEGHDPDNFEVAVLNVLSTAGWLVQWYGDDSFVIPSYSEDEPRTPYPEIDVIAYHPKHTQILFVECTNQDISGKEQILDRSEAVSSVLEEYYVSTDPGLVQPSEQIPCLATPQKPEALNDEVVSEFEEKGIEVLHSDRLRAIHAASQDTTATIDVDTQFIEVI